MTTPRGAILLGYGGSEHSKIALTWADTVACQLSRPLHVVMSALDLADVPDVPKEHRAGHVADELDRLLASAAAPSTSVTTVLGSPGDVLVRAAATAHLTVLGARTQGPLRSMVTGSVSQHVTRHAPGPVVVVREPRSTRTGRIVVGIDGSEHSLRALEFALRHSHETNAHVVAVHAREQQDSVADQTVERVVERVFSTREDARLDAQHVRGSAPEALADASHEADLVVIGTRGRSPLRALLVGSVTQSVLQHSQCPVAVVR